MVEDGTVILAVSATGAGLITFVALPSLSRFVSDRFSKRPSGYRAISLNDDEATPVLQELFEDDDGRATEESEEAYTATVQMVIICVTTVIGIVMSTLEAVFSLRSDASPRSLMISNWLDFAAWVVLGIQAASVVSEKHYTKRYNIAARFGVGSLVLFAKTLVGLKFLLPTLRREGSDAKFQIAVIAVTGAVAFIQMLTSWLIPRRPEVYHDDKMVERQFTASLLGKYTFSWPGYLLRLAKTRRLEKKDFPALDHQTRAVKVVPEFRLDERQAMLWTHIFKVHRWGFTQQGCFAAIQCFLQISPHFMMLQILRALEKRNTPSEGGEAAKINAWTLVFALGAAQAMSIFNDSRLFWTMWSKIGIPLRSQLQALIFEKAMKRKDCKAAKTETEDEKKKDDPKAAKKVDDDDADGAKKSKKKGLAGEKGKAASQQDTINLVAVDSFRVSNMGAWFYLLPASVFKITISLAFLWKLIGWESLLAGVSTNLISTPLNWYFAKRYRKVQSRVMKVRDRKMAVVTEVLQGIRQIKFSALEAQWEERIAEVREEELKQLWKSFVADSVMIFCSLAGPIFLAAVALSTYALVHGELSPSVAFTALGVFQFMENQFGMLPDLITEILDAWISAKRIQTYFEAPDKLDNITPSDSISLERATVGWPSDDNPDSEVDRFLLRDISVQFPSGELSVISGKTGSGKSLLLASLIGEIDLLRGKIHLPKRVNVSERHDEQANADNWIIPSSIAFVSQIPFIENASIKDNILFGLPFVQSRYDKVLKACALVKDLEMFTDGDRTEVGAAGISLSGGQRWRLTFARALYSRAGILILDDVFSAVDAHVGKEIFLHGLTGELAKGRTRILVTHHVALCLPRTKYAVMLNNGEVEYAGMVEDLQKEGVIGEILKIEEKEVKAQEAAEASEITPDDLGTDQPAAAANGAAPAQGNDQSQANVKAAPKKFVEEEKREAGGVKMGVYLEYIKSSGGAKFWLLLLCGYIFQQGMVLSRSWWVKVWTASTQGYEEQGASSLYSQGYMHQTQLGLPHFHFNSTTMLVDYIDTAIKVQNHGVMYYIGIYAALSIATAIMGATRYILIFVGSIKASRRLFYRMTYRVLRMPLRWVDTVPLGRIINRFTFDFNILDTKLSMDLIMWSGHTIALMGMVVAGMFVSPYVIFLSLVIVAISVMIGRHFLDAARDVKRLESVAKSPIFEQFSSALKGVSTIRAFDKSDVFNDRMRLKVDTHAVAYWHLWLMNRWVGFRLSMVGLLFSTGIAAAVVSTRSIDAALAGFALSFALQFTQSMQASIRQYANMELDMNSVERVVEYSNLETEDQGGADVPASWPTEGRLTVNGLVAGYAPELPSILKGLSFSAESRKRVGVVGRTGAGKSTLTLALFRFLETREGSINIDGIDISKIKLHDLRSRMAIIPQDPVLFSGTVRTNLDPFGQFEDEELMQTLMNVHLIEPKSETAALVEESGPSSSSSSITNASRADSVEKNKNIFENLSSPISDGGMNLSQGQRQLLCLARAIISRPKVMVLDEATSSVDMVTDSLIQRSIREGFNESTVLCIAHRLVTVADFDQILVMSDGKAAEFGTPKELMEAGGIFYSMVQESGDTQKLEEMILGSERS